MRSAQHRYRPERDAEQTPEQFARVTLGIAVDGPSDDGSTATIRLTANLVETNAQAFRRVVSDLLLTGVLELVVDFTHCPYADSRGLGALVGAANDAKKQAAALVVLGANEDLRTLFQLTKLDKLFEVRP